MITVHEADRLLRLHARPARRERVPLSGAAGRVLAEEVVADRPYPPFDRVAMDGIAIAFEAWEGGRRSFRVARTQPAGAAPRPLDDPRTCVEIMTGAALPPGADTVVRREDLRLANGTAEIVEGARVRARQNVHFHGMDAHAGAPLLLPGTRLLPTHVAALASLGRGEVQVAAFPRVAVVTTGDELVAVDAPPEDHQIRQSNGHAVRAALGEAVKSLEHARDTEEELRGALGRALETADLVVVSGGVSAGRFDLVPRVLEGLGVTEIFHRIRQKPGKPLWFGVRGEDGPGVFGLPGNPVSALVCLCRYVIPWTEAGAGAPARQEWVHLETLPPRKNDFTLFVPVRKTQGLAHPVPSNGSGDFLSILPSDGFAELAAEVTGPRTVPFFPWSWS